MIYLNKDQILPLVNAEWLGNGPIRLNPTLTLENLPDFLVFTHHRQLQSEVRRPHGG
ncbi:MAG: hypothetical protein QF511_12355 [Rhodospirillales bacterium]|nr:hypothetical protein [Rhodospirillales bacterium]MDP7216366.1 hypothetical protein [Rhodospirillales bacterium]HJP55174.1 hypothetical protein [Rhodospirillales bacterium]